jgi:hypothetical protein
MLFFSPTFFFPVHGYFWNDHKTMECGHPFFSRKSVVPAELRSKCSNSHRFNTPNRSRFPPFVSIIRMILGESNLCERHN